MAANEKKATKRTNKFSSGVASLQPLFQGGVYFLLLILVIGGLYWLNQKGKEITSRQQESTKDSNQFFQKNKQQILDNDGTSENRPTGIAHPTELQNTTPENRNEVNDFGAVGSLNHQYLQPQPFSKLIVEIDHVDSVSPSQSSVNTFLSTIKQFVDKPDGVVRSGDNSLKAQKDSYSVQDLLNVAKTNRSNYSQGNMVSLYVLYVNGEFAENTNALGVALNSSMFVIFKDKINEATTALVFAPEIEKAVLNHELGHLWGLVNITYQSGIDHEDKEHPHHSKNRESVMFWAVEDISVANLLRGGPPYQFDSADQDDIEKIKKGVY